MKNILTIDVESWVHFSEALEKGVPSRETPKRLSLDGGHLVSALDRLLDLLDQCDNRATFFVLGELMEWNPEIVRKIQDRGHEVGYHGHNHRLIDTPETLQEQLSLSADFIEEFRPRGFRAPRLYLLPEAMEVLKRFGFAYSSSSYGPFESNLEIGGVREIPISSRPWRKKNTAPRGLPRPLTPSILGKEIPFGSAMVAGMAEGLTSHFIRHSNRKNLPAIIMLHPWQVYPPEELTGFKFQRNIALRNPQFLPYAFTRPKGLRKLIISHKFTSFTEYLQLGSEKKRQ